MLVHHVSCNTFLLLSYYYTPIFLVYAVSSDVIKTFFQDQDQDEDLNFKTKTLKFFQD